MPRRAKLSGMKNQHHISFIKKKGSVGDMADTTFAKDTSTRSYQDWAKGLLVLFIGLTIAHLGVSLFLISALGSDPFTVLIQGISLMVGLSIGTCHVIALILLMLAMVITTKGYVKPGTVVCAFCGGWIIDLFLWLFGDMVTASSPMVLRLAVLVAGCVVLSLGMSIVIKSNSGTGPNDLIAIIVTDKLKKFPFARVRMGCDAVFTVAGVLMGGVFGIGTIVAVALIGPVVQFFLPHSEKAIAKLFPTL